MEITQLFQNVYLRTHFLHPTEAKQGATMAQIFLFTRTFFTVLIVIETFMKCLINTFHIFEIFTLLPLQAHRVVNRSSLYNLNLSNVRSNTKRLSSKWSQSILFQKVVVHNFHKDLSILNMAMHRVNFMKNYDLTLI